jgi:transposase
VRALGVDDWARYKGQTYGTILVDLKRHKPIDLLPDREASNLANWLRSHPDVEFISRDRAGAYADGARQGAPQAVQIADRWHLLKNLTEAVERFMDRHHHLVRQAANNVVQRQLIDHWLAEDSEAMLSSRDEAEKLARRQKRYARYLKVRELYGQGVSERGISRALSINRATVRKFVHADAFPERAPKKSSGSILDPYIHRRWAEGYQNAMQLRREIKAEGYSGKEGMVRRYIRRLRAKLAQLTPEQRTQFLGAKTTFKAPTSRRGAWWLLKLTEDLVLAVSPLSGEIKWEWIERMRQEYIRPVLQEWALEAVVWDKAPSHRAKSLAKLGTIRVFLPSYSPELNPAERIFEEVRRHLEGKVYESLPDKREEVEIYLKKLAADPERVKSLCGWGWLRESLESLPLCA